MVGAGDSLVPPQATYRLHGALDAAGIPNECVVVPYGNHLMDMVDGSMLNRAYLELTLRWFERFE
jgi:dipeptidyl aminopeptidase/acylaminoacyl peptidase